MDDFLIRKMKELLESSRARDIAKLKDLGGDFAEKAYLRHEQRMVNLIVISYAMAKFLEKHYVTSSKEWGSYYDWYLEQIGKAIGLISEGAIEEFFSVIDSIVLETEKLSEKSSKFQSSVVSKARIKAATQVYAHGASLSTAADFAKVNKTELSSYINVTKLPEKYGTLSVKQRLKMAEEIFGV